MARWSCAVQKLSQVLMGHLSKPFEWTLPMKYANYIHACVQTLLVGKRHRVVHWADVRSRLHHAAINRVQNSAMFPYFANQNVNAHVLCAIYIFHGKGILCTGLYKLVLYHPVNVPSFSVLYKSFWNQVVFVAQNCCCTLQIMFKLKVDHVLKTFHIHAVPIGWSVYNGVSYFVCR